MTHLFRTKLRVRLTVLYVSILSIALMSYAAWSLSVILTNLMRQLDIRVDRDMGIVERLIAVSSDGSVRVDSGAQTAYLFEIWSEDGKLVYRSNQLAGQMLGQSPGPDLGPLLGQQSVVLPTGNRLRVTSRVLRLGDRTLLIRVGTSEDLTWRRFRDSAVRLILGVLAALLIASASGYFVARYALRPLEVMALRAKKISAERLNERLEITNADDEVGQLAQAFNETLTRLERSFEQLKRFTADASHELRTPLTAIRSVGEVALQTSGDIDYFRDVIGSMLEEANRLTHLVNTLLTLSRVDAGKVTLQHAYLPLLELATESAVLLEVLAEEKNQSIRVSGDDSIGVLGDRLILRQAFVAVIHNAIKYSPLSGKIDISIAARNGDALIEVRDTGPGIPADEITNIFERFYRIDKARTGSHEGAGLGLSIAKWAVGAHGGTIEVESDSKVGCIFRLTLPRTSCVS